MNNQQCSCLYTDGYIVEKDSCPVHGECKCHCHKTFCEVAGHVEGVCDKSCEHCQPTQPTETWEVRLDEEFRPKFESDFFKSLNKIGIEEDSYIKVNPEKSYGELKDFIRNLLAEEREKLIKYLLENGHGGGNYRRLLEQLKGEK